MIVYKTTNLINGKIYIGYDTKNDPEYFGSGLLYRRAENKYGKENFRKAIIDSDEDFVSLCRKEIFWIDFYDARNPVIGYNIAEGGQGGDTFTHNLNKEELRQKNSDGHKGKTPWNKGKKCPGIGGAKKGHIAWNKGVPLSEKHKENLCKSIAERGGHSGKNNPRFGSCLSDELKSKISESCKGRIPWNKGLRIAA